MSYNTPTFSGIPFSFTNDGYKLPDFDNIPFKFGSLPTYQQTSDLQAAIGVFTMSDLSAEITPLKYKATLDLTSVLSSVRPIDLASLLHGYDFKDIAASLHSWAQTDVSASIGSHLPSNLGASVAPILPVHLNAWLHGWATFDLGTSIIPFYTFDLSAQIRSTWLYDLISTIYPIPSKELQGLIHAWHTMDLPSELIGGYGPYDLQAYLRVYPFSNLQGVLKGVYTGYKNLAAAVEGWNTSDLMAMIDTIYPFDLGAILTAQGKTIDLPATIIPSIILLKRMIQIPLMERKDLSAIINFACFGSAYKDLYASMYTLYKKDLSAYIIGWHSSSGADRLYDLGAFINTETLTAQDKITIQYLPLVQNTYARLKIAFAPSTMPDAYKVMDILQIFFGTYHHANLQASINGILESINLKASITPTFDYNYSELPDYVRPKTHEVFINLARGEVQWRRFIELMFDKDGTSQFKYFYVDGSQKVYKMDRERHWTIWATGYTEVSDSLIERANIRKKFIFDVSKYSTVDEAIRELMERAAYPSWKELSAYIDGGMPPYKDLSAELGVISKYSWSRNLRSFMFVFKSGVSDFSASVDGLRQIYTGDPLDLSASIVGDAASEYDPPMGDELLFNFTGSAYTPPSSDNIVINWTAEDT